jgi:nitroimidazol reductase NimA-like FMN-containing flavoprotein (pyridoxamine 5'-phosphate oxidase superfamily)
MSDFELVLHFLQQHKACVLSTIGQDGRPQAAVVSYSVNDLAEFTFGTEDFTRKYRNLLRDSRVAVVVGFEDTMSVQYEGAARQLAGEELAARQKEHFAKLPEQEKNKDKPGEQYFSISPTWMRLTDTSVEPWDVHEVRFDDERV